MTRRDPTVDEHVIAIVRLLGLECLHMVPSIKLGYALITAFVKRWHLETHSFHLPHGEMTITLQDVEVIMGVRERKRGALKKEIWDLVRAPIFWVVVWSHHLFFLYKKRKEKINTSYMFKILRMSLIE